MEQRTLPEPAEAGEDPGGRALAPAAPPALPPDPQLLTPEHLDAAWNALAFILRSPQALIAGKRPVDSLKDAMRQLDHYHAALVRVAL